MSQPQPLLEPEHASLWALPLISRPSCIPVEPDPCRGAGIRVHIDRPLCTSVRLYCQAFTYQMRYNPVTLNRVSKKLLWRRRFDRWLMIPPLFLTIQNQVQIALRRPRRLHRTMRHQQSLGREPTRQPQPPATTQPALQPTEIPIKRHMSVVKGSKLVPGATKTRPLRQVNRKGPAPTNRPSC